MSRPRVPLQQAIWAFGTLVSLVLYAARALPPPRSTAVGVEQRLFGGTGYRVLHHPANDRWLVSAGEPAVSSTPAPSSPINTLATALTAFDWPAGGGTGRALVPFRSEGTWSLEPFGLRRVWRLSATEAEGDADQPYLAIALLPAVLNLKTGRTYRGAAAEKLFNQFPSEEVIWDEYPDQSLETTGLFPPEDNLNTAADFTNQQRFEISGRRVFLLWNDPPVPGIGIYAASDHAAPRVLRLAAGAALTHLSPDGRTLFFQRQGALWRLNLRRPLPDLLDAAVPPVLPEPQLDKTPQTPPPR